MERLTVLFSLLLAACVSAPTQQVLQAQQDGLLTMRQAMLNQTAVLDRTVDEVAGRNAPPEAVRMLRDASDANSQQFDEVYRAQLSLLNELGMLTFEKATFLMTATAEQIRLFREGSQ